MSDKMKKGGLYDGAGSEWDEREHPRDEEGEFVAVSKLASERQKLITAIKAIAIKRNAEETAKVLGAEFKDYKGQAAIDKLMREQRGHIKAAFHREDIGDIDLLWGDDSLGLQHILIRREAQGINAIEFVEELSEVVEKGEFHKLNYRGNIELWYKGKMAVIAPEYHGTKMTFLLTAYKRTKK